MKLKPVTKVDPMERRALRFRQSFVELVAAYREFYERQTDGQSITESALLEQMGRQFMDEDKGFQKFLKSREDDAAK